MLYNKGTFLSYMRASGERLYVMEKNCVGKLEHDMHGFLLKEKE